MRTLTYEFPCGKYRGMRIMSCEDKEELLKFIYYPLKAVKIMVRDRLKQLDHALNKENFYNNHSIIRYDYPNRSKIDIMGTLVFTCCEQTKLGRFYAVQIYRCEKDKFIWLYTFNPPIDELGKETRLRGMIYHHSRNGKPVTLLVPRDEDEK